MSTARRERLKQARKRGINRFLFYIGKLDGTIDASGDTGVAFTVYARSLNDPEYVVLYFNPVQTPYALLAQNASVLASIQSDGNYWIERVAYQDFNEQLGGNPPPSNMGDMIHTHENDSQGGQLNASLIFDNGAVPVGYGGTNIASYAVGDLLYASAAGVLSKLAVGSNGNIYHVAGGLPVSGTLNLSTANLSGLLAYARGGLNVDVSGLTTGALLVKGASAASGLAPGTSGNIPQSNGSIWQSVAPSFAASVITSGVLAYERGGLNTDVSALTNGSVVIKGASNATGVAPGSDGDVLTVVAGAWASAAAGAGSSPFTTTSNVIHQNTLTDAFAIGTNINSSSKVYILGDDTAEITTRIKGASGQSAALLLVEEFGGDGFLTVSPSLGVVINQDDNAAGDFRARSQAGVTYIHADASAGTIALDGAVTINDSGADVDFRVESDTQANALFLDGATGAIQQLGNTPSAYLHMAASTTALASGLIPPGTAPSSPVEGQFWNEATYQTITGRFKGNSLNVVWTLFAKTDLTTVSGTTAETSILGTVIPSANTSLAANFFTAGCSMLIHLGGFYSVSSGSDTSCILRVKLDSVNILQVTLPTLTGAGNQLWNATIRVTCRTTGAAGTFISNVGGMIANTTNFSGGSIGSTVDTTDAKTFDVTIDPNTANTSFRCDLMIVEILN